MDVKCTVTHRSETTPGVEFDIMRMTFGRRMELMVKIRELMQRREFADAGTEAHERMEGALLSLELDRIYLEWGFYALRGLTLDGDEVGPLKLWFCGPEALTREVIAAIRAEAGLNEDERKN
jgi:hypothetical protein